MIKTFNHYFQLTSAVLRFSVQRQLEYPLFLVSWVLLIPIQAFAGLWMLRILADRFENIAGWSFGELAFLYGLSLLSHALIVIFFIQTWSIEDFVIRGGFDRLLVRPINVLFHFIVSGINLIGVIDLIPAVMIFFYACSLIHFEWSYLRSMELAAILLGATLIRAGIYLTLGSAAFWTKKSRPLVVGGMITMERATSYPQTIFPYLIQVALTFILPIGFITFYPSAGFLGKPQPFIYIQHAWAWTLVVGLLVSGCACIFFRMGLRRYESSGS